MEGQMSIFDFIEKKKVLSDILINGFYSYNAELVIINGKKAWIINDKEKTIVFEQDKRSYVESIWCLTN